MAGLKTKVSRASVVGYLNAIEDTGKRTDTKKLLKLFKEATGLPAKVWGDSIVGFGKYHYKSERSKQEGEWPLTGFAPRKQNLTIYIMPGFTKYASILEKLGPHKTSVGCLYIKRLSDVHLPTLTRLITQSVKDMQKKYHT